MISIAPPLSAFIIIESSFISSFKAVFSARLILFLLFRESRTTVRYSLFDLGGTKLDLFFAIELSGKEKYGTAERLHFMNEFKRFLF